MIPLLALLLLISISFSSYEKNATLEEIQKQSSEMSGEYKNSLLNYTPYAVSSFLEKNKVSSQILTSFRNSLLNYTPYAVAGSVFVERRSYSSLYQLKRNLLAYLPYGVSFLVLVERRKAGNFQDLRSILLKYAPYGLSSLSFAESLILSEIGEVEKEIVKYKRSRRRNTTIKRFLVSICLPTRNVTSVFYKMGNEIFYVNLTWVGERKSLLKNKLNPNFRIVCNLGKIILANITSSYETISVCVNYSVTLPLNSPLFNSTFVSNITFHKMYCKKISIK